MPENKTVSQEESAKRVMGGVSMMISILGRKSLRSSTAEQISKP